MAKDNGYIKIYRDIFNLDFYFSKRFTKAQAWIDLLLLANYEDAKVTCGNQAIVVKRGQIVTSTRKLAKRWNWHFTTVSDFLIHLTNLGMCATDTYKKNLHFSLHLSLHKNLHQRHSGYTVITINNYDKYQDNLHQNLHKRLQKTDINNKNYSVTTEVKPTTSGNVDNNIYINNNNSRAKNARASSLPKTNQRLPEEKQTIVHRLVYLLEDTLETKIVNWGKQGKAITMMAKAGYTEKEIGAVIRYMATDDFYQDKGFDLMTVANNIDKIKARFSNKSY